MIAPSTITVTHGKLAVRLRPSLGAAYRLDVKHGSFGRVVEGVQQMNVGIIADILAQCGDDPAAARRLLISKIDAKGAHDLEHLIEPLFCVIADCYGVRSHREHPAERRERATGEPFNMRRALEELFAIATGWLGWSVADTLAATPLQIIAAHEGHIARLKAIHGTTDDAGQHQPEYDPRDLPTDAEIAANIAKLKAETKRGRR